MPQSVLSRTFTVSLLLHASVIGLLALEASRRPMLSDAPLRVRILEPPAVIQPPPAVEAGPRAERGPIEVPRPASRSARGGQPPTERLVPRPIPVPDRPAAPVPTPRSAAPPLPEPVPLRAEKVPEPPRETPRPPQPERRGLSLSGPPQGAASLPEAKGSPPPGAPARPSLREQIASLGSGLAGDLGGPAKETISLDSREARFSPYLSMVKRRVERIWEYPDEALAHGVGGDVQLVFTLNSAGSLIYIRLVQSSGYPVLDEESLRAVKLAAPFDPFLPQMGDEPKNIRAIFHYTLPPRFRRN